MQIVPGPVSRHGGRGLGSRFLGRVDAQGFIAGAMPGHATIRQGPAQRRQGEAAHRTTGESKGYEGPAADGRPPSFVLADVYHRLPPRAARPAVALAYERLIGWMRHFCHDGVSPSFLSACGTVA